MESKRQLRAQIAKLEASKSRQFENERRREDQYQKDYDRMNKVLRALSQETTKQVIFVPDKQEGPLTFKVEKTHVHDAFREPVYGWNVILNPPAEYVTRPQ